MRWTKLKQLVEQNIAPSLGGRIAINSARYGACSCGHAWITLDGEVIANFDTIAYWNRMRDYVPERVNPRYAKQSAAYGEFSRQGVYKACFAFVHDIPVAEALEHADPIVQALAVIDRRVGKRRLAQIDPETRHPLVRLFLAERLRAEGMAGRKLAA